MTRCFSRCQDSIQIHAIPRVFSDGNYSCFSVQRPRISKFDIQFRLYEKLLSLMIVTYNDSIITIYKKSDRIFQQNTCRILLSSENFSENIVFFYQHCYRLYTTIYDYGRTALHTRSSQDFTLIHVLLESILLCYEQQRYTHKSIHSHVKHYFSAVYGCVS